MNRVAHMPGRRLFVATFVTGAVLLSAGALSAQQFEVASVKPAAPGARGVQIQLAPGGRFTAKNVNVRFLMQQAFGVRDFQISGAPGWTSSERYDITAKAEGDATQEKMKPMLQHLLEERFGLKFHRETKEAMGYALVVAKGGPKLKKSAEQDGPQAGPGPGAPPPGANGPTAGFAVGGPGPGGPGGPGGGRPGMMRMGRGMIDAQGVPLSLLTNQLSNQLGRKVVDNTGLTGNYDIKLEWTPDDSQQQGPREVGGDTAAPVDSAGPSVFTALQEQLGLRLEGQKGPVDLILVDKIEKPVEN